MSKIKTMVKNNNTRFTIFIKLVILQRHQFKAVNRYISKLFIGQYFYRKAFVVIVLNFILNLFFKVRNDINLLN